MKTKIKTIIFIFVISLFIILTSKALLQSNEDIQHIEYLKQQKQILDTIQKKMNNTFHNPSYIEMKAFLAVDKTDEHEYTTGEYTCSEFAYDVIKNASKHYHIRSCFVVLMSENNRMGHSIVAFNTTDRGIIYIEPQNQNYKELNYPVIGKEFEGLDGHLVEKISETWNNAWTEYP